jgi:hypothetical protein
MTKGYSQKHEINYDEVFAPITRSETIWLIIAIVACCPTWMENLSNRCQINLFSWFSWGEGLHWVT